MLHPSTFSIVALDPESHEVGVATQSKFLAVGSVVPWAAADAGAVATQSWANTSFGPRGLELLRAGTPPQGALNEMLADDPECESRQVGIVDLEGRAATFTGSECFEWAGGVTGINYACQGNILAGPKVVWDMATAFESAQGQELADRLVAALRAAQAAGGDARGKQSAALLVVKPEGGYGGFNDRYIDLRVDDHPDPIEELARLLRLHKLYYPRPDEPVLPLDESLISELAGWLSQLGYLPSGAQDREAVMAALDQFSRKENLEERLRDDGLIYTAVVDFLRSQAESVPASTAPEAGVQG